MSVNKKQPFINLTRLVIQTTSPMAIYSGGRELGFDNQLARDANGLPSIPASTIAGVWRHSVQSNSDEETADRWFGSNKTTNQHASILQISNGDIHNSKNESKNGILKEAELEDTLLQLFTQKSPHKRERVKINDLGSASSQEKFDQILLPTGARFTIDIRWSNSQNIEDKKFRDEWDKILQCWNQVNFAFGSSTRNGLGRFKVINKNDVNICLQSRESAIKKIKCFNKRNNETKNTSEEQTKRNLLFEIELQASSTWRCGSSQHALKKVEGKKDPHALSYSEKVISWNDEINQGKLSEEAIPILCGSSIKGILAHRITFHYNCLTGNWADDMESSNPGDWEKRNTDIDKILGCKSDNGKGQAGLLMIPDCEITFAKNQVMHRTHNSINRFTGGVMPGALFTEELLYKPKFTIKAYVLEDKIKISEEMQSAINKTLDDLKTGRLSIGTGTGRGTSLTKAVDEKQETAINSDFITTIEYPKETIEQELRDE